MRMAKRGIARREGFEKCLIPWKELIGDIWSNNKSYCLNFNNETT